MSLPMILVLGQIRPNLYLLDPAPAETALVSVLVLLQAVRAMGPGRIFEVEDAVVPIDEPPAGDAETEEARVRHDDDDLLGPTVEVGHAVSSPRQYS